MSSSPSSCGFRLPALRVWLGRSWRLRKAYLKYASLDSVLAAVPLCHTKLVKSESSQLKQPNSGFIAFFMIWYFIKDSEFVWFFFFPPVLL